MTTFLATYIVIYSFMIHRPYNETNGIDPKPSELVPLRSLVVCSNTTNWQKHVVPKLSSTRNLETLDDMFLATTSSVPDFEGSLTRVTIGPYTVDCIHGHKREGQEPPHQTSSCFFSSSWITLFILACEATMTSFPDVLN